MVKARYLEYDRFYYRMIGDKEINPQEAYKVFYNFLKTFKFIGTFHYYMNIKFGTYAQLYKSYFIERVYNYQKYCDEVNISHTFRKGNTFYPWYRDEMLLFPFAYDDDYSRLGHVSYQKVKYIQDLWTLYYNEQKLNYSIIKLENNDENISNTRHTRQKILEECGFTI